MTVLFGCYVLRNVVTRDGLAIVDSRLGTGRAMAMTPVPIQKPLGAKWSSVH